MPRIPCGAQAGHVFHFETEEADFVTVWFRDCNGRVVSRENRRRDHQVVSRVGPVEHGPGPDGSFVVFGWQHKVKIGCKDKGMKDST